MVGSEGGDAVLASAGDSVYRELQISVRQVWSADAQLFVSYVHATTRVESNDFGSMFTNLDTPLLEPNDTASPAIADVPHRLRAWSTFTLPRRVVISPAVEWRTGFPYSVQDMYRHYVGGFNTERLPVYFAVDLTAFKTVRRLHAARWTWASRSSTSRTTSTRATSSRSSTRPASGS